MRQLVLSRVPVDLSVVELDLDAGEEVFLTYTWERREGPGIVRTGKGPPYMDLIGGRPGQTTTHAFGLRLGTWLVREDLRAAERERAEAELKQAEKQGAPAEDIQVLRQTVDELQPEGSGGIRAHDAVFRERCPGYRILGQQGSGDLTMNEWNVAFVSGPLTEDRQPVLVCLPREDLEYRTYSCLVKWRSHGSERAGMTIEEVRFHRRGQVREPNQMVWVRFGDRWLPRGDLIELAVSNQQVLRDGRIVPVVTSCHEYGDLRHLVAMPNLNPDGPLAATERPPGGKYRPRWYFNNEQFADVWLGEEPFLADPSLNLRRASLAGPVFLDFAPGAAEHQLRWALLRDGYREVASPLEPLAPGDWRFVRRGPQVSVLEVYFRRNIYAWSMVGLSADRRRVLWLACQAVRGRAGYTVEQAARILLDAGASDALLMDEGTDVFQVLHREGGALAEVLPLTRHRRLRATILAAAREAAKGEEA